MKTASKLSLLVVLSAFLSVFISAQAQAFDEGSRTANRSIIGRTLYPENFFEKPAHYEFLPLVSNWDPRHDHPAMWDGQDWDVTRWNPDWTPEIAVQKFFEARIFSRQYMRHGTLPVLEVGPTFYKLSDLDRRRTLKLLTSQTAIFNQGYDAVQLVDWSTKDIIGIYTPKGMFLN